LPSHHLQFLPTLQLGMDALESKRATQRSSTGATQQQESVSLPRLDGTQ